MIKLYTLLFRAQKLEKVSKDGYLIIKDRFRQFVPEAGVELGHHGHSAHCQTDDPFYLMQPETTASWLWQAVI